MQVGSYIEYNQFYLSETSAQCKFRWVIDSVGSTGSMIHILEQCGDVWCISVYAHTYVLTLLTLIFCAPYCWALVSDLNIRVHNIRGYNEITNKRFLNHHLSCMCIHKQWHSQFKMDLPMRTINLEDDNLRAVLLQLKSIGLFCDVTLIAASDNSR